MELYVEADCNSVHLITIQLCGVYYNNIYTLFAVCISILNSTVILYIILLVFLVSVAGQ